MQDSPRETHPRQQDIVRVQGSHQAQQDGTRVSTTTRPSKEYCQEGNPDIQGPPNCNSMRHRQKLPTLLMGRHTTTSRAHAQPPKTITTTAKCVGIRLPLRTAQLRQTTICTTGMQSGGPHDAKHQRHVGRTHCKRVLRGMFTRTLPMPQSIRNKQQEHSSIPNSFFQAKVSNTTIIHQS